MTELTADEAGLSLTSIEARLVRTPISTPVRTSFGVMHDRPTLLVRVTDASGARVNDAIVSLVTNKAERPDLMPRVRAGIYNKSFRKERFPLMVYAHTDDGRWGVDLPGYTDWYTCN